MCGADMCVHVTRHEDRLARRSRHNAAAAAAAQHATASDDLHETVLLTAGVLYSPAVAPFLTYSNSRRLSVRHSQYAIIRLEYDVQLSVLIAPTFSLIHHTS